MAADIRQVISESLGVQPVVLDASMFTPQVRRRLYWCNFPVLQPVPRSVPLADILIRDHDMKNLNGNSFRGVSAARIVANRPNGASRVFAFTTSGHYDNGMISRNDEKANTITTVPNDLCVIYDGTIVRRLDCVEAERLQGLPDGYTDGLPRVRRWKCIGNSFTANVVEHILESLKAVHL
jgi:site-specific DNA-cytosine methylase